MTVQRIQTLLLDDVRLCRATNLSILEIVTSQSVTNIRQRIDCERTIKRPGFDHETDAAHVPIRPSLCGVDDATS